MRKIVLYIAMTLDGYIADENDDYSFLNEYDALPSIKKSYESLTNRIDTLIMGRITYDIIKASGDWPYNDFQSYIISSQNKETSTSLIQFEHNIEQLINTLKTKNGKDIWLVGGGILIETFLKKDWIDEYQITIIPKLIGKGKPLFHPMNYKTTLKRSNVETMDDIVMLTYTKI